MVEPGGIGIEQRLHIRGQPRPVAHRRRADIEQRLGIIDLGAILTQHRPGAAARHRDDFLQGGKIILGMGIGDAVSDVGIGLAKDVRHPELVARDADVLWLERRRFGRFGGQRLPQRQRRGGHDQQQQKPQQNPSQHLWSFFRALIRIGPAALCDRHVARWQATVVRRGEFAIARRPAMQGVTSSNGEFSMNRKSLLLAACLSVTFVPPALAQTVVGSGVVPATAANSAERPIGFAASAPPGRRSSL